MKDDDVSSTSHFQENAIIVFQKVHQITEFFHFEVDLKQSLYKKHLFFKIEGEIENPVNKKKTYLLFKTLSPMTNQEDPHGW